MHAGIVPAAAGRGGAKKKPVTSCVTGLAADRMRAGPDTPARPAARRQLIASCATLLTGSSLPSLSVSTPFSSLASLAATSMSSGIS